MMLGKSSAEGGVPVRQTSVEPKTIPPPPHAVPRFAYLLIVVVVPI